MNHTFLDKVDLGADDGARYDPRSFFSELVSDAKIGLRFPWPLPRLGQSIGRTDRDIRHGEVRVLFTVGGCNQRLPDPPVSLFALPPPARVFVVWSGHA